MKKLSIIIPVYNEGKTIAPILEKVFHAALEGIEKEIIVVDDASTDTTSRVLDGFKDKIKYLRNDKNSGKGYSVRRGIKVATGDLVIVQDADLEYDPADYPALVKPILENNANAVYGSRFTGPHNNLFYTHLIANKFITFLVDIFFNTTLSDVEVGYKVFRKSLLDKINLQEDRFGFEIEVTVKVLKLGEKIFEVPITYVGRDYAAGKKIGFKDGLNALWAIFKYRFFS
jgi:glycosyltransferase involved in cell wall biosynthesis